MTDKTGASSQRNET